MTVLRLEQGRQFLHDARWMTRCVCAFLALLDARPNSCDSNTVPIWFNDFFPGFVGAAAAQLNVELPRGCANTKSTFTPGLDKVTMQIKFR